MPNESRLKKGCKCPKGLKDFAYCLDHCLKILNSSIDEKYSRIKSAMLIDYALSIENTELTPSMKLAPNVVGKVFKANIENLYGANEMLSDKVYIIELDENAQA